MSGRPERPEEQQGGDDAESEDVGKVGGGFVVAWF